MGANPLYLSIEEIFPPLLLKYATKTPKNTKFEFHENEKVKFYRPV